MIMYGILLTLLAFLVVSLFLTIKGPSIWDRLLGMDLSFTKVVVIIIVFSSLSETGFLLDYAAIYVLSGFIGTIFIALFGSSLRKRRRK